MDTADGNNTAEDLGGTGVQAEQGQTGAADASVDGGSTAADASPAVAADEIVASSGTLDPATSADPVVADSVETNSSPVTGEDETSDEGGDPDPLEIDGERNPLPDWVGDFLETPTTARLRLERDGMSAEGSINLLTGEGLLAIASELRGRLEARGQGHVFPATPNPRCSGCGRPQWMTKPGETCLNPKVDDGQTDKPAAEGAA